MFSSAPPVANAMQHMGITQQLAPSQSPHQPAYASSQRTSLIDDPERAANQKYERNHRRRVRETLRYSDDSLERRDRLLGDGVVRPRRLPPSAP